MATLCVSVDSIANRSSMILGWTIAAEMSAPTNS